VHRRQVVEEDAYRMEERAHGAPLTIGGTAQRRGLTIG
jgi:hypothetical protein